MRSICSDIWSTRLTKEFFKTSKVTGSSWVAVGLVFHRFGRLVLSLLPSGAPSTDVSRSIEPVVTLVAQDDIAVVVDFGLPARRHDDRRIHLLDDRRAVKGRSGWQRQAIEDSGVEEPTGLG